MPLAVATRQTRFPPLWKEGKPNARPSLAQAAFVTDFLHELDVFLGGYGSGKTHALAHKALWMCRLFVGMGATIGAVGPSFPAMKQDLIPACLEVVKGTGLSYTYNRTELRIDVHPWQVSIKFATADKPETLQGPNWSGAVGNEPGLWPEIAFFNLLSRVRVDPGDDVPKLVGSDGVERTIPLQVALAGTPEGFNWLYKHTAKRHPGADVGADPYCRIYYTSTHDAHWLRQTYVDTLKRMYASDLYDEKVMGRFVPVGQGRVYGAFSRNANVAAVEPFDAPVTLTLDFNVAPAVGIIHQHVSHPDKGTIVHALDEIVMDVGTAGAVVREFVRRWAWLCRRVPENCEEPHGVRVIGDATGNARTAVGPTAYQVVFAELEDQGLTYSNRVPTSNPTQFDRVSVANRAYEQGTVVIHPRCDHLIEDLEQVLWKPGTREIDKTDPTKTHCSDAHTYDVFAILGINRPSAEVHVIKSKLDRPWASRVLDAPWKDKD